MKKILILTLFLTLSNYSNAQEKITKIGNLEVTLTNNLNYKIGNLEVALKDLHGSDKSWEQAFAECAMLGDGWRLPTKDELNVLYRIKDKIGMNPGKWNNRSYWSSTEYGGGHAWVKAFGTLVQDEYLDKSYYEGNYPKRSTFNVRAVRTFLTSGYPSNTNEKINKIGNLEVAPATLTGVFSWEEASAMCAKLGDGWRLPTKDELNVLYQNKDKIGGFIQSRCCQLSYWSSTEYNSNTAWTQNFINGNQNSDGQYKDWGYYVRAVRTF
jgi:hypothetical protein